MKMKKALALTLAAGAVAAPFAITAANHQVDHNIVSVQEEEIPPEDVPPVNSDDGLTDWAITGIAVASAVVAIGIGYGIWYYYKKRKED